MREPRYGLAWGRCRICPAGCRFCPCSRSSPQPRLASTPTSSRETMSAELLLHGSLIACVVYFTSMCAAHFAGFKVPILFVYWNVPRSEEHTSELQSLMRISYAVFCLKKKKQQKRKK